MYFEKIFSLILLHIFTSYLLIKKINSYDTEHVSANHR